MGQSDVVVTGLGLITALGPDLATTWARLLRGETAISLRQPFPELPVLPLAMVGKHPARLEDLLRPVVAAALEDAGLSPPLPDCGVVVGSSRSDQTAQEALARDWIERGQAAATWLETLPGGGAIATAHQIGSQGPVRAPMAACATGLMAIAQAADMIRRGECDQVLVAAAEAPITPLTLAGFLKMGALAKSGCYPFDQHREGLVLGEGAAALVLEAAAKARQRQVPSYGRILGVGLGADGHHISAPDPKRTGSRSAILSCLQRSGLTAADIGFIHAHGTGTQLNDAHESALIEEIFPASVAVSSTKGATGHTLGASGALGGVFSLLAMRHQSLPPTAGLRDAILIEKCILKTHPCVIKTALCFSFGFGGQNLALAISC